MADQPLVVAGAGIAGLALATALQQQGRRFLVLDERPELGSSGGGITLWPNALAALDALGLGDDVRVAGRAVAAGSIRTSSGRVLRRIDQRRFEQALGEPLIAIRRGALIELLAARVDSDAVRPGCGVRGYAHDDSALTLSLDDGSSLAASALVGADGFRSVVARQLAGGLHESYAGYPAWRAIAPIGGFEPVQFWGRGQEFGLVPLDAGATYWFAARLEPAGGTAPDGELAHLAEAFAGWPTPVPELLAATPETSVNRVDIVDRHSPGHWCEGPVVVIGDAAHAMRPHLGQGGCQALVDAAVLAARLESAPDVHTAFLEYVVARRPAALRVARKSHLAGRLVTAPPLLHRLATSIPEGVFLRQLAAVGSREAFRP